MTKLNSPLLSLDAHGTIGNALTFQSSTRRKFAREKPKLPYSLTLAQQYQRWQYEDYCRLWHEQTQGVKDQYRTAGVPHHLTAFQYWMKVMLGTLPDIVCGYRMDERSGVLVPDFSRNAITLTKYGPVYTEGLIAEGLYFDGINDYLLSAYHPALNPGPEWSFSFFMRPESVPNFMYIISRNQTADKDNSYMVIYYKTELKFYLYIGDGAGNQAILLAPFPLDTWHYVTCGVDGSFLYLYVNDQQAAPVAQTKTPLVSTDPLRIGNRTDGLYNSKGIIDNLVFYNRLITYQEHLTFSKRRYPI